MVGGSAQQVSDEVMRGLLVSSILDDSRAACELGGETSGNQDQLHP